MDSWPVVIIYPRENVSRFHWELFEAQLMEIGSLGVSVEKERPDGVPVEAKAWFPKQAEGDMAEFELVKTLTDEYLAGETLLELKWEPDRDWNEKWAAGRSFVRVSEHCFVGPPDQLSKLDIGNDKAVTVAIEYSGVFGLGDHDTTVLCLLMLEEEWRDGAGPGLLLDVGTGTGVLAFAAVKQGAEFVLGVDNDPRAVETFAKNAHHNGAEESTRFELTETGEEVREAWKKWRKEGPDLVVCNMLMEQFIPLLGTIRSFDCPVIITGFLDENRGEMEQISEEHGWRVDRRWERGVWMGWRLSPK